MKVTTVKDVMTDSVVAVRENAGFKEMVTAMRSRRISAFPVIDASSRVLGVVSEADLLLKKTTRDRQDERAVTAELLDPLAYAEVAEPADRVHRQVCLGAQPGEGVSAAELARVLDDQGVRGRL